jgi:hypothetical protein
MAPMTFKASANPGFDPKLQAESVTCVACHAAGPQIAGVRGDTQAPHPVTVVPALATADACTRCHQTVLNPLFKVKRPLIDTVSEWQTWKRKTGRGETCQECHMPAVERAVVANGPVRSGRRHTFGGASDSATAARALALDAVERTSDGVSVLVTNLTGHRVPTGDGSPAVEIRVVAFDATGAEIARVSEQLVRVVKGPPFEDVKDTTLGEAESRRIAVRIADGVLARVARVRVSAEYHYYGNAPHLAAASKRPPSVTMTAVEERF